MSANLSAPVPRTSLFLPILGLGVAQFAGAFVDRPTAPPVTRRGSPPAALAPTSSSAPLPPKPSPSSDCWSDSRERPSLQAVALLALALAAMLGSFPTREAWENALREAQIPGP